MVALLTGPRAELHGRHHSDAFPAHREKDAESSLMHFRAMSYDPRTGRFVQNEPLPTRKEYTSRRPKESRRTWQTLEAYAKEGILTLLQRLLEEEVSDLLGRERIWV
jgi:hypothetical protein